MLKKYQSSAGVLTRFADLIIVISSWLAAYPIRFQWLRMIPFDETPAFEHYLSLLPMIVVLWVAGFQSFGLYRYEKVYRRSTEIYTMLRAHFATLIFFTALAYFITQYRFSRGVIIVFGIQVAIGCWLFRVVYRKILRELHKKGVNNTSLFAVGEGKAFAFVVDQLNRYPEIGVEIIKIIGPDHYDDAISQIKALNPKILLLGLPRSHTKTLDLIIDSIKDAPIDLQILPDYSDFLALGARVENFEGVPLVQLNESPLIGYRAWMKRLFDFVVSAIALLILSPLLALVAILVKITSRGPVLYRQERMGLDGRTFHMLKFRSMRIDAEDKTGAVWAVQNDDRRTPIGTVLRSTSVDELPQLWNVLVGDMSVVGPRPERPVFVSKFKHEIPNYMLRHRVKTGITGWAQVNGWRGDTSLEKRIECDLFYIRNWSLWFDLKIMVLTVFKGFINKNAY
ncbi:MAG: undecaprenyl-phosphate glucose phosphotransferase [Bdellovibrionales bacterium]|nr:undecaprenyl-phosphate glucose phosphotransferase [Bdellovibrionales bacterium]